MKKFGGHSSCRALSAALMAALLGAASESAGASESQTSRLWGESGELWSPQSRLPDFSFAGYRRGEKPIPSPAGGVSVKEFGARGDGRSDDTAAIQKAIEASPGKVVHLPAGYYVVTDFITIRRSGTVLRGAGRAQTVLMFSKPLNVIEPNWGATTGGRKTSNYSWSGGFVTIVGQSSTTKLAEVMSPAGRGDQAVIVSSVDAFKEGDEISLVMRDAPDKSLAKHLYADDPGSISKLKRTGEFFVCRVTGVDREAKRISFDRPLRTDIRLQWQPEIFPARSSVEEAGIEGLSFAFPNTPYQGHFTELGFNAVDLRGVRHCWVRDIRIHNSDNGIFVSGVNNTIENILVGSSRQIERSRKATGHHGVTLSGQDNLLTRFSFETRFMHGVTVTRGSAGNVVSDGRGVDLSFDHHRYGPHSNLFTDIYLGEGSRMFQSGGGGDLGRHSAAYATFWGIRARNPQSWPAGWRPDRMNLVGVQSKSKSVLEPNGRWMESIDPNRLHPRNLHKAQLERRLKNGVD